MLLRMGMRELFIGAIVLGAAGGYYWSTPYSTITDVRKVPASQRPPAAALADVLPTVEDAEADSAWSSGGAQPEVTRTHSSVVVKGPTKASTIRDAMRFAPRARHRFTQGSRATGWRWTATATESPANRFANSRPARPN